MQTNDYCILSYLSVTQADIKVDKVGRIIQIFNQSNITIADRHGTIHHSLFLTGLLKQQISQSESRKQPSLLDSWMLSVLNAIRNTNASFSIVLKKTGGN